VSRGARTHYGEKCEQEAQRDDDGDACMRLHDEVTTRPRVGAALGAQHTKAEECPDDPAASGAAAQDPGVPTTPPNTRH